MLAFRFTCKPFGAGKWKAEINRGNRDNGGPAQADSSDCEMRLVF